MPNTTAQIRDLLGKEADDLLSYTAKGFKSSALHLPGPDFIDRVVSQTDRKPAVLRNFQLILGHGRLGGTGHVSILPVDQGIEHSAAASFAPEPIYFDPENIVKLAIEGGCNAVASTLGVLGAVSRKYAHKIPFLVKLNHNELLSYPNKYDQILFGNVDQAFEMGAVAVGATIYFGSAESDRQIQEISAVFAHAHELGLVTVLWCYLRNDAFKQGKTDYDLAADLTGQANHLGVTIQADIIKQKLPETNGGYTALKFGKTDPRVYSELTPENHPIEMTRYQIANCYLGRSPLINSGGASGKNDFGEAARTAVINKRAGGMGLITGRKAFQRPMAEGVKLLNLVQDIYLDPSITIGMKELAAEIVTRLSAGERLALCTVVATKGSTPQSRGAKMLVLADGRTLGTLGGGCVEAEVRRRSLELLSGESPAPAITSRFSLDQDYGWDDGLICGGVMDIHLAPLNAAHDHPRFSAIAAALHNDRSTSLEFEYEVAGRPMRYVEDLGPPPVLLIVGAGHVGACLAKLASELDFRVDVMDDRVDALTPERFPTARHRLVGDIGPLLGGYPLDPGIYVVIVTRGHRNDGLALASVIDRPSKYVGLIGSKRKIKAILDELSTSGVPRERLLNVHAPIGLEIGAVSVQEIALSIAAELVAVRRGRVDQPAPPMKMSPAELTRWLDRPRGNRVPSPGTPEEV